MTRHPQVCFASQTHTDDIIWRETVRQGAEFGFDFVKLCLDGATKRRDLHVGAIGNRFDTEVPGPAVHLPLTEADYLSFSKHTLEQWWEAVVPAES